MKKAISIFRESFSILRKYPRILIPFVITGISSAFVLYLVYLTPQRPVSYLFGPPVRAFYGAKFLHYPFNLYLLPKLFYYASVCVGATVGMLMTALAIGMIKDSHSGKIPAFFPNLLISLKRYFALFGIWFVPFILSFSFVKATKHFYAPGVITGSVLKWMPYITYIIVILIQIIFIYAVPALIIERRKIISSILRGVSFFGKFLLPTLILVFLPVVFYIPVLILKQESAVLMGRFHPEIIIAVLGLEIFVSFAIDALITVFAAVMFLKEGKKR